jgi:hypothetical protein
MQMMLNVRRPGEGVLYSAMGVSSGLPPDESRPLRSRNSIEASFEAGVPFAQIALELLLDLRDLVAECAWRLSEIEAKGP